MDTKTKIIKSARRLTQRLGYNGFSYADISAEVGIRKASLHHHFPTKADLGLELVSDYTIELQNALVRITENNKSASDKLAAYFALYRTNLGENKLCLGGMMATDLLSIDPPIVKLVGEFFGVNIEWLEKTIESGKLAGEFSKQINAILQAQLILSALQGGLIIARAVKNNDKFDNICEGLFANLKGVG